MIPASVSSTAQLNIDSAYDYLAQKAECPFEPVVTIGRKDYTRTLFEKMFNKQPKQCWLQKWKSKAPNLSFMMVTFFDPYVYLVTDEEGIGDICIEDEPEDYFDDEMSN